jgi:hypothetical protein
MLEEEYDPGEQSEKLSSEKSTEKQQTTAA